MEHHEHSMNGNRCPNCMREITANPCPYCGFDEAKQPQPDYALPYRSILRGRYLVGAMLGQGGFGITYVGLDLALEVKVAIKEYYPSGQVSRHSGLSRSVVWSGAAHTGELREEGMDAFLREARKMARMEDIPEIVRVRDTFYENETAYIVMDFVEGETLTARLQQSGPLPFEDAMRIFRPAMLAMGQVHEAGMIHRDLSPDNMMMDAKGRIHILDLGAAKDMTANRGISSMMVARSGFSPIEQYSQRGGSGPWSDVYAMAATVYYTLTGVLPPASFDRINGAKLYWDLPQLAALPEPARAVLQKALAVTVNDRVQSMAELLAGLEGEQAPEKPAEAAPAMQGPSPTQAPDGGQGTLPAYMKQAPQPVRTPDQTGKKAGKFLIPAVCAAAVCLVVGLTTTLRGRIAAQAASPASFSEEAPSSEAISSSEELPSDETAVPSIPPEAKEIDGGTCGVNVGWTLFDEGTLLIFGRGSMNDFDQSRNRPPWYDQRKMIRTLFIQDGVTRIGGKAFCECSSMTSIVIPESMTEIGSYAFLGCTSLIDVFFGGSIAQWRKNFNSRSQDWLSSVNVHYGA